MGPLISKKNIQVQAEITSTAIGTQTTQWQHHHQLRVLLFVMSCAPHVLMISGYFTSTLGCWRGDTDDAESATLANMFVYHWLTPWALERKHFGYFEALVAFCLFSLQPDSVTHLVIFHNRSVVSALLRSAPLDPLSVRCLQCTNKKEEKKAVLPAGHLAGQATGESPLSPNYHHKLWKNHIWQMIVAS